MKWIDGSEYKGEWSDGMQNGYGKMIFASGEIKEGLFVNGNFKLEGTEESIKIYLSSHNLKASDASDGGSAKAKSFESSNKSQ